MTMAKTQNGVTRRSFLGWGIGACTAFVAALLGVPAVGAIVGPALRVAPGTWVPLGDADSFADQVPTSTQFTQTVRDGWTSVSETKGVWVVRHGSNFTVFNSRCTHLGCAYHWNAEEHDFVCPCHGGKYALDGHVLAGPPPRPLDTLSTRVEDGKLYVHYEDFRLGTSEKVSA